MVLKNIRDGWMYSMETNDFKCNCGFWISEEVMDNESFMEYAIKEHAEQHMRWRMAYVSKIFSGNQE